MSNNLTTPDEKSSIETFGSRVRDISLLGTIGCVALGGLAVTAAPPLIVAATGGEVVRRVGKRLSSN